MPESIKMAHLQNAVKDIPQLSIVETLDEYTSTTSGAGTCTHLTYKSYYNLLINACVRYDATNTSTPPKRRNVYTAPGAQDLNDIEEPQKAHYSQDIDKPSDDFYQVHQAKQGDSSSTPISGFQRNHPRKPTPSTPKKPFKTSDGPVYVCAEVYKLLSPEVVAALKKYNTEAINKFAKKIGIHVTDIADHESPPSEDTTHEDQPDPHQFDDAPENEIDHILDYINCQHHQEEDMNNALQAYNVMASPTPMIHPSKPSTWSIPIYSIMLHRQNKPNMVHLWIGVPMVDLQVLM